MNNLTDINVAGKAASLTQNEKEEITIDIEENAEDLNTNQEIVKLKDDNGDVKDTDQPSIHIEKEFKENSEPNVEVKKTKFEYGGTERKPPAIWVQYNQAYGQGQVYPQYQGYGQQSNYGGGTLEYDPQSRNYFVKFVFILLFVMLLITAMIGIFINTSDVLKEYYQINGLFLMICSMIVLVAMNYVMAWSTCGRVPPCNFISLVIVVLAMSNLVGAITVRYRTHILIFALLATMITVAVCVLLACSSFDFTKFYLFIVAIAVAFAAVAMMVSVASLVFNIHYKPMQVVLLFVGAILNVVILVLELQMVLGGRAIEISEDDYALAAYLLYSSIVDIFLKMVQIMGLFDE